MAKKIPKVIINKWGLAFVNIFLLAFMVLIFGPAEIFFGNYTEFDFVYGEFAGYLAVAAVVGVLIMSIFIALLPGVCYKIVMSIVFGISVAGYIQVMFLNQKLDLLGLNPDGYQVDTGLAIGNLCIWLVVIIAVSALAFIKTKLWESIVKYISSLLLGMQLVALISLLLTAGEDAYQHPTDEWKLSGESQYVVSANENVIVIILDYFSNQYLPQIKEAYPDFEQPLHDFTYYSNADCHYFGTFPSIAHMFSMQPVDPSIPINDWFCQIWTNPNTVQFYETLKEKNYVSNMYTSSEVYLCGTNDAKILSDKFSNVTDKSGEIDVFYKRLFKVMIKMSCYRMSPELIKNCFYTEVGEYSEIISYDMDTIEHENDEFYAELLKNGLTVDNEKNYFIVQHLMGTHTRNLDENCQRTEYDATLEQVAKGCMVMVEEYLNQLKELGVYDNSTIIITSDHGNVRAESQVIFYVKEKGVTNSEVQVNNAPISLDDLLPTVAEAVGVEDHSLYGFSIYDFSESDLRERENWSRAFDPNYPNISHYAQDRKADTNVYHKYKYTGDYDDLYMQYENGNYEIVPMYDSFF